MKHSWTALCWAVLALGLIIACTRKPQPTKPDKLERFNAALAAAGEEPTTEATTPRKRADRRPKADDAPEATDEAPAES